MPSSKEYLNFILDQLSGLPEITHLGMMGEYIIYYRGRIIGGIFDDRFLVKPIPEHFSLFCVQYNNRKNTRPNASNKKTLTVCIIMCIICCV